MSNFNYIKKVVVYFIVFSISFYVFNSLVQAANTQRGIYAIQLMACKHRECVRQIEEKSRGELSDDDARILEKNGFKLLTVGSWSTREGAIKGLSGYIKQYPDAYVISLNDKITKPFSVPDNSLLPPDSRLSMSERLKKNDRKNIFTELGYLYSQEGKYCKAAENWEKSLEIGYDDTIATKLASMYVLTDQYNRAYRLLNKIDKDKLPLKVRAEAYDNYSRIYYHEKRYKDSIDALKTALDLDNTADRNYRLGLLYKQIGKMDKAEECIYTATELDPGNTTYNSTLGYMKKNEGDFSAAADIFETVLEKEPDYLKLYEELGYIHTNLLQNEEAVKWFKRAIDNRDYYPVNTRTEETALDRKMYRLKKEVVKLTNRYDFTFYESYRTDSNKLTSTPAGIFSGGAIPSQGGMEFAYQPPKIGFRNERIFQLFGRLLWNNKTDSLKINGDSIQGGLGLRYKPLRRLNLFFSGERLFEIGDDAIDDWLFRVMISKNYGLDPKPGSEFWNYTQLYGDTNYIVHENELSFFWSLRQGITANLSDNFLLTPHILFEGRYQRPDRVTSSYIELGPALSLRYLFDESKYKVAHHSIEFILQYNFGWFIGETDNLKDDSFNGIVLNTILRF